MFCLDSICSRAQQRLLSVVITELGKSDTRAWYELITLWTNAIKCGIKAPAQLLDCIWLNFFFFLYKIPQDWMRETTPVFKHRKSQRRAKVGRSQSQSPGPEPRTVLAVGAPRVLGHAVTDGSRICLILASTGLPWELGSGCAKKRSNYWFKE